MHSRVSPSYRSLGAISTHLPVAALIMGLTAMLIACGGDGGGSGTLLGAINGASSESGGDTPAPPLADLAIGKAACGSGDRPELGMQGQIPMVERTAGFQGFSCNLEKTTATRASRGDGPWQQFVSVRDRAGHLCGFAGGAFRTNPGTVVVDLTDPNRSVETALLTTAAALNPGEGLRAHEGRGLLVTAFYNTGPSNEAITKGFDVYDVGADCRHPQLLASTTFEFSTADLPDRLSVGPWPNPDLTYGHEGAISPDGLTYYISDTTHGLYHAIDLTDPTLPKLLASFRNPGHVATGGLSGGPHGLSISSDGTRAFFVSAAYDPTAPGGMVPQTGPWHNGFVIADTSDIQARKPNPTIRFISQTTFRDGSAQQMTIPMLIKGKKYLVALGEGGTGQFNRDGIRSACAAGKTPFAMAKIFDIEDELSPTLVNNLQLEVNDPKKCAGIDPEVAVTPRGFMYDVHMCSVDNRDQTTTLACGYFQSGLRVYDVRDPTDVNEIAYFNPASKGPGVAPGWCGAIPILDATSGMMYSSCADSGIVSLKFKNGVWPFSESKTPPDKQL